MKNRAKSKFNVDKCTEKRTYDGVVYDSRMEMLFYRDWVLPRINNGEIESCKRQVKFELQPSFEREENGKITKVRAIDYVADYVITYKDGNKEVIDIKGFADSTALLKRKLFWYKYPDISYKWLSYSKCDGGWIEYEDLKKARKARKKSK